MKNYIIKTAMLLSLALWLTLSITSCKKDGPTVSEIQLQKLQSKTWAINSVTVDGVDQTSMYTGMTLKVSGTNLSTTKGGVVWPSSSTWNFNDANATTILRDDQVVITISEISDTSLTLELDWSKTTLSGGKTASLKGHHKFIFK